MIETPFVVWCERAGYVDGPQALFPSHLGVLA
jgi:hypothetical protein